MRHIGFDGGSFLCELGPSTDIETFFSCLELCVVQAYRHTDYTLLTDRLYRRYLRLEELETAQKMMSQVQEIFSRIPSHSIEWKNMGWNEKETWLDINQGTLADIFYKYFEHFNRCIKSAKIFFDSWEIYQPVRIVIADQPWFMVEKNRPLSEYDNLEGKPFWLVNS